MAKRKMPWWAPSSLSLGFGIVLSLGGQFMPPALQALAVIGGILFMLLGALALLWHVRDRIGRTLFTGAALLLAGSAAYLISTVWRKANTTIESPGQSSPSVTSEISLDAYWRPDSVVGGTLFSRFIACGDADVDIVARHVVLPGPWTTDEPIAAGPSSEDPKCRLVQVGNLPVDSVGKPTILILVYQRRGDPQTMKTTAYFFEPTPTDELGQNLAPVDREDLPGNQLERYRQRQLEIGLSEPVNTVKFQLPEMFAGNPVQMGFGAYGKAFLFDPITRAIAFCANQGGKVSSRAADLNPSHAGGHSIVLQWDDPNQTIGMTVDGNASGNQSQSFADGQCVRSIRPPVPSSIPERSS